MADKSVIFTLVAKDSASAAIKGVTGSMHGLHGASGKLTSAIGGLGGALTSLPAIIGGAGVVAAIVGMTKAAADDEAAQKRLGAAAKANIPGFDGNTAALEKVVTATQNMAFTDDAARDSLTRLLTSTKNVEEATRLNGLAMDFARLKGIPLADAANVVAKAHDGNFTALSKLGIVLKDGATATDALAAIQAISAGQAQTYADTTAGGMDRVGIGIGELGESIGTIFLPIMSGLVTLLNGTVIPAIDGIVAAVKSWFGENSTLVSGLGTGLTGALSGIWTTISTQVMPAVSGLVTAFGGWATFVVTELIPLILDLAKRVWEGGLGKAIGVVVEVVKRIYQGMTEFFTLLTSNQDVMNILKTAADLLGIALGLVADFVLAVFDALGTLFGAITSNKELMAGLELVVKGIWTGFQSMAGFIGDVIKKVGEFFTSVTENEDVMNVLRAVVDAIATGFGTAANAIGVFWSILQELWNFVQNNPVADVLGGIGDIIGGGGSGKQPGGATGGMIVGENGPETFIPFSRGVLLPNGIGPTASGASSVNISVNVSGAALFDPYGVAAQQIADALVPGMKRALARNGMSLA